MTRHARLQPHSIIPLIQLRGLHVLELLQLFLVTFDQFFYSLRSFKGELRLLQSMSLPELLVICVDSGSVHGKGTGCMRKLRVAICRAWVLHICLQQHVHNVIGWRK